MQNTNPLLDALKLPGRIFQLPSRGLFYKNGELSPEIHEGEIHVHPMSALDEITLKNPDQLFSGGAVNTVFKHCIDGIEKPSQLLSKDVDAIMLFLRVVTYGAEYQFTAHHDCEGAKDHSFMADIDKLINDMKIIDPTTIAETYTLKLQNGQVVKLRPNVYQQVLDLIKLNENQKQISVEDQQRNLIMMLLGIIDSVDGISDQDLIKEWITKVPSPIISSIANKVEGMTTWGTDLMAGCKCPECGKDYAVEIPINAISFFTE